jgi:LPS export ABC transporter protein LptC
MKKRPHAGSRARRTLSAAGLLACGALLLLGCGGDGKSGPTGSRTELPDQEVTDFVLSETDLGRMQWKMYAQHAAIYGAKNLVLVTGLRVDFFDENQQQTSELRAREGDLEQRTRNMTARGDVVIQTSTGVRMQTQSVKFLNDKQKIVTDDFVRVERGQDVLTGYGFESDPTLEHFEFKRQVRADVRSEPSKIEGDRGGKP